MTEPRMDRDPTPDSEARPPAPVHYPTNQVVGVVDTPEQIASVLDRLTSAGFLESEITVGSGQDSADALRAATGRSGLLNLAIRVARKIGVADDEMMVKDRYEQALRDGKFVVGVTSLSAERKRLASDILRDHGAHFINFLGRFAIESIDR